jgi:hypothetical protein
VLTRDGGSLSRPAFRSASFGTVNNERKERKMGLDMYAHFIDQPPDTPVDFEAGEYGELHYWRKHPNFAGLDGTPLPREGRDAGI